MMEKSYHNTPKGPLLQPSKIRARLYNNKCTSQTASINECPEKEKLSKRLWDINEIKI